MKKRIAGGTIYALLFYMLLLTNHLFDILLFFFLVFGVLELVHIIKRVEGIKNKVLCGFYSIIFILFIFLMHKLYDVNSIYIIFFAAVIMFNDTFAYLCGSKYGKTQFTDISPNKTVEGLLSGIIIGPIVSVVLFIILSKFITFDIFFLKTSLIQNYNPFNSLISLYIFSVFITIVANVGDLVESYFKRQAKIKDSGNIVYGHGGVLDRMDSLIFPMIIVALLFS